MALTEDINAVFTKMKIVRYDEKGYNSDDEDTSSYDDAWMCSEIDTLVVDYCNDCKISLPVIGGTVSSGVFAGAANGTAPWEIDEPGLETNKDWDDTTLATNWCNSLYSAITGGNCKFDSNITGTTTQGTSSTPVTGASGEGSASASGLTAAAAVVTLLAGFNSHEDAQIAAAIANIVNGMISGLVIIVDGKTDIAGAKGPGVVVAPPVVEEPPESSEN